MRAVQLFLDLQQHNKGNVLHQEEGRGNVAACSQSEKGRTKKDFSTCGGSSFVATSLFVPRITEPSASTCAFFVEQPTPSTHRSPTTLPAATTPALIEHHHFVTERKKKCQKTNPPSTPKDLSNETKKATFLFHNVPIANLSSDVSCHEEMVAISNDQRLQVAYIC